LAQQVGIDLVVRMTLAGAGLRTLSIIIRKSPTFII
jgi:hypothetical protein